MAGLGSVEQCTVLCIEFLIAAAAVAGVKNGVLAAGVVIRIAGIYLSEIGEQRNEPPAALINSDADAMNAAYLSP